MKFDVWPGPKHSLTKRKTFLKSEGEVIISHLILDTFWWNISVFLEQVLYMMFHCLQAVDWCMIDDAVEFHYHM